MSEIEKILSLQKKLQQEKEHQIEVKTELKTLLKELKEKYECDSAKEALIKLEEIEKEIEKMQTELNNKIEVFEDKYHL